MRKIDKVLFTFIGLVIVCLAGVIGYEAIDGREPEPKSYVHVTREDMLRLPEVDEKVANNDIEVVDTEDEDTEEQVETEDIIEDPKPEEVLQPVPLVINPDSHPEDNYVEDEEDEEYEETEPEPKPEKKFYSDEEIYEMSGLQKYIAQRYYKLSDRGYWSYHEYTDTGYKYIYDFDGTDYEVTVDVDEYGSIGEITYSNLKGPDNIIVLFHYGSPSDASEVYNLIVEQLGDIITDGMYFTTSYSAGDNKIHLYEVSTGKEYNFDAWWNEDDE